VLSRPEGHQPLVHRRFSPALDPGWMIAAILMAITIIGLPWTRAAFNIGVYTLLSFGQKAVSRPVRRARPGYRTTWRSGQCLMACPRRLVAGAGSPHHSDYAVHHHYRDPIRLSDRAHLAM
jgi:hypothetical protein